MPEHPDHPVHFESFNYLANIFYASFGLDAYEKVGVQPTKRALRLRRLLQKIYFIIVITNKNICLLSEFMYILLAFANNKNFEEATKLTSFMGFVIVSDIKVFSIWSQRARIGALMRDLYALYPKTLAEQQLYNVKGELQRYKRFAYAFILLHEVLVWSYNLFPLLNYLINDFWLGIREVIMELPYYCWMPFDWRGNWRFYPMLIHQMGAGQASFSGQLANDLLLSAVAVQLIMHYRRLARQLETHAAGLGSDTEKNENISQAVYNRNWYDADLRYKKIILLIMQRAQKPAKLQATSLVTVTMSTMTGMLQISYKGFAVIRTMYAREPRKV
ncbi:putative odorant receptor 85d [Anastrepha obliqua]|uniref:putative odorant receptor 85d n=1 Tax=Anastrepha obliqua TaxID=95512 RepID=UPI0024098F30|nr:putative odorant receptor 85d [Anastrepha obliqua]